MLSEIERASRTERARLVARLARRTRDLDLAEDAVQDAFAAAATTWPRQGVPERPAAWLWTVAWRRALDVLRAGAPRELPSATVWWRHARHRPLRGRGERIDEHLGSAAAAYPIRPGSARALAVMLDRLGEVVPYAALSAGPQDSLRRDVGRLRAPLKDCGIDVDVVRYVGYRLRHRDGSIAGQIIGNLILDSAALTVYRGGRSRRVGLSSLPSWIPLPTNVPAPPLRCTASPEPESRTRSRTSSPRIGDLRRVLRDLGSKMTINTWTVYDASGGRTARYML